MPNKKFTYANQKSTPCNINAQRWYLVKALNSYQKTKNPYTLSQDKIILNYYLNKNLRGIKNFNAKFLPNGKVVIK